MKGYKGFHRDGNGMYCNPAGAEKFYYEVGKTYTFDKAVMCCQGAHFCQKAKDVWNYYPVMQWTAIAEIEATGHVMTNDDKSVTDEITIVRLIGFDEFVETVKKEIAEEAKMDGSGVNYSDGVNHSDGVNYSKGVHNSDGVNYSYGVHASISVNNSYGVHSSYGVNHSKCVNYSDGVNASISVNDSNGVHSSDGVNHSDGVNYSNGVNHSYGINASKGVNASEGVHTSYGVNDSYGVNYSCGIFNCHGVNLSFGINASNGVHSSDGVNRSYGIFNCHGVSNQFFNANVRTSFKVFNKKVSDSRYHEIVETFKKLSDNFIPQFNNLKGLYLQNGSDWKSTPVNAAEGLKKEEAWKDLPQEAIDYLSSLPEFNAKIFYEVTGIKTKTEKKS